MDGTDTTARERLLARFGVSRGAEDVWRLLIAEPQIDRTEASQRAQLTTAELDDALEELVNAFLVRVGSTPLGVVTIDPQLALESRLAAAEREMAEQAEAFSSLRLLIPQLSSDYSRGRAEDSDPATLDVVEPLLDIQRQIDLAASRVTAEIRALDHAPAPSCKARTVQRKGMSSLGACTTAPSFRRMCSADPACSRIYWIFRAGGTTLDRILR